MNETKAGKKERIKDSFVMYRSVYECAKDLSNISIEKALKFVFAVFDYALNNVLPDDPEINAYFKLIKPNIDSCNSRYESICERNRKNGKEGGRPKKTQKNPNNPMGFLETQKNPKEPQKAYNENYNYNDCYNDNEKKNGAFLPLNSCLDELLKERTWIEKVCSQTRRSGERVCSVEEMQELLREFFNLLECRGEALKTLFDAKNHFTNWVIQRRKGNTIQQQTARPGAEIISGQVFEDINFEKGLDHE